MTKEKALSIIFNTLRQHRMHTYEHEQMWKAFKLTEDLLNAPKA